MHTGYELENLMIGPAWTYDASVPKPLGVKDMGDYTVAVYTKDQLAAMSPQELFSFSKAIKSVAHSPITKAAVSAGINAALRL